MNMPNDEDYSDGKNDFDDDEYSEVELNLCEIFYRFEMEEIIAPTLKFLKKYYKNDQQVYDIYSSNSKIYILTVYTEEFIFTQLYDVMIHHCISYFDKLYTFSEIKQIIEIKN